MIPAQAVEAAAKEQWVRTHAAPWSATQPVMREQGGSMGISRDAIETAAKALALDRKSESWFSEQEWDGMIADQYKEPYRRQARLALEAAAPHMLNSTNEGTIMTEHEELLKVLLDADEAHRAEGAMWPQLVDAILAAGYRKTP